MLIPRFNRLYPGGGPDATVPESSSLIRRSTEFGQKWIESINVSVSDDFKATDGIVLLIGNNFSEEVLFNEYVFQCCSLDCRSTGTRQVVN